MSASREEIAVRDHLRQIALDAMLARHRVRVAGQRALLFGAGAEAIGRRLAERGATVERQASLRAEARLAEHDLVCAAHPAAEGGEDAWERALTGLAEALRPGGWLILLTDPSHEASAWETALIARGLVIHASRPTRRFTGEGARPPALLRRFSGLLVRLDRGLVLTGLFDDGAGPRLLLARKPEPGTA